eukprot:TRINITY_DN4905_c0_g1_i5.p2 TRINITY_DN4905_c0_g1~~TRINITY_DN4905_c0_g1_i5.p2  ORF type:complete len:192 (-),score=-11.28 TRINITY_DN4905_c0_g1_i5:1-576(-)
MSFNLKVVFNSCSSEYYCNRVDYMKYITQITVTQLLIFVHVYTNIRSKYFYVVILVACCWLISKQVQYVKTKEEYFLFVFLGEAFCIMIIFCMLGFVVFVLYLHYLGTRQKEALVALFLILSIYPSCNIYEPLIGILFYFEYVIIICMVFFVMHIFLQSDIQKVRDWSNFCTHICKQNRSWKVRCELRYLL